MDSGESNPATTNQKTVTPPSSGKPVSTSSYKDMNSLVSRTPIRQINYSQRSLLPLWFQKCLSEESQLYRFDAVKHLAPDDSIEDILEILHHQCWLVQGLWVPKSSVIGAKDALARDYIISLFKKNTVVSCNDFTKLDEYQYIQEEAERQLSILAVYKPSCAEWELKEPRDVSFINSHPDIVKRQEFLWAHHEKKILVYLKKRRASSLEGNTDPKIICEGNNGAKVIRIRSPSETSANTDQLGSQFAHAL